MYNATIHTFKASGKWYTTGRGIVDQDLFMHMHDGANRRRRLLTLNSGKCPGLSSAGDEFNIVVIPDESVNAGWPLLLLREST